MGRKLSVGDKVQCRLYNTPSKQFYGTSFTGKIEAIDDTPDERTPYLVRRIDVRDGLALWMLRKELLRRLL